VAHRHHKQQLLQALQCFVANITVSNPIFFE
jgi:hypothetical protein